jgi:hypothetical protein
MGVRKITSGRGENTGKGSSSGFVRLAPMLTTKINIVIIANRFILIILIMLYQMVKNGFSVRTARSGTTLNAS